MRTRVPGPDRYAIAAAVATGLATDLTIGGGGIPQVLVAFGEGHADALADGAAGAVTATLPLLTRPASCQRPSRSHCRLWRRRRPPSWVGLQRSPPRARPSCAGTPRAGDPPGRRRPVRHRRRGDRHLLRQCPERAPDQRGGLPRRPVRRGARRAAAAAFAPERLPQPTADAYTTLSTTSVVALGGPWRGHRRTRRPAYPPQRPRGHHHPTGRRRRDRASRQPAAAAVEDRAGPASSFVLDTSCTAVQSHSRSTCTQVQYAYLTRRD